MTEILYPELPKDLTKCAPVPATATWARVAPINATDSNAPAPIFLSKLTFKFLGSEMNLYKNPVGWLTGLLTDLAP